MNSTKKNRFYRMRVLPVGLALLVALFVSRGYLYRFAIQYNTIGERAIVPFSNKAAVQELDRAAHPSGQEMEEMVDAAIRITNDKLRFSTQKTSQNPDHLWSNGKANCIGYAALFASTFSYLASRQGDPGRYKVKHLIGKLEFFGLDVHAYSTSPFFQDHDFNVILDTKTGKTIYVDPSVADYLWINRVKKGR